MEIEKHLLEITKRIEIGKEEFSLSTKKAKYYIDSEYSIVYEKPVDILLKEYNKGTQIKIDKFFDENIPFLFENKECKDAITEFNNLINGDLNLRINASKYFRQKALNATIGFRTILFKRPDTFQKLIVALKKEENDYVIRNLIIAIGGAYRRYFKYYDVYNTLSPFLYHKNSEIRYYTIIWISFNSISEKEATLKLLLKQKQSKKIIAHIEEYFNK